MSAGTFCAQEHNPAGEEFTPPADGNGPPAGLLTVNLIVPEYQGALNSREDPLTGVGLVLRSKVATALKAGVEPAATTAATLSEGSQKDSFLHPEKPGKMPVLISAMGKGRDEAR